MKILRVGIKNINSLKLEESIDFLSNPLSETGLFAIVGDTGSGKTTLLDAITLGLYGKVAREASPGDVMSYGATDTYAEVDFETLNGKYRSKWTIWRSRGKQDGKIQGPKRELSKWNEEKEAYEIIAEKISEVTAKVEEISGLDYVRFTKSVLLSQGDFAAFLKSKESERSDLLERITGTEIYSRLSIASHQKKREAEAVLSRMEMERDAQHGIAPDELKALNSDLRDSQSKHQELKAELERKKSVLTAIREVEKLKKEQIELTEEKAALEAKKAATAGDFGRLALHKKLQPVRGNLALYRESFNRKLQSEEHLKKLLLNKSEAETLKNKLAKNLIVNQSELKAIQDENREKQELFEEIIELDLRTEEPEKQIRQTEANLNKKKEEELQEKEQLDYFESRKQKLEEQKQQISDWLERNRSFGKLSEQLPKIQAIREELRDAWKTEKKLKEEYAELTKAFSQYESEHSGIEKELKGIEVRTKNSSSELKKIIPEKYASTPSELLNLINKEIEELGEQLVHIRQLHQLTADYREMLREIDENEAELRNLQHRENQVNSQIITALEMVDDSKSRMDYKQKIYEQQRLLASYEEERRSLKKGEPCPLCFSAEHSLEKHDLEPFVNETRDEFEKAKNQYEVIYKSYRGLLNTQQEIQLKIDQLAGIENQELNGEIRMQLDKILNFEKRFEAVGNKIGSELFLLSQDFRINEKVQKMEIEVLNRRSLRGQIAEFELKLKKLEKDEKEARNRFRESEKKGAILSENLKNNERRSKEIETEKQRRIKSLNDLVNSFGHSFAPETAKEMFAELETAKADYETHLSKMQEVSNSLIINEKDMDASRTKIEKILKELLALNESFKELQVKFSELKGARAELFGEKDPKTERQLWNKKLEEKQESVSSQKLKSDEQELIFQTLKNDIELRQKDLSKLEEAIEKTGAELLKKASQFGIHDLESVRNAVLDEEEAKALESLERQLEKSSIETANEERRILKKLEELKPQIKDAENQPELEKEVAELSENTEELLRNIGSVRQKLEHQSLVEKKLKKLLKEISGAQKSLQKWARLADLIGSSDGKKFRAFAQSLTLEKLAQLANNHLQRLDGRYLIRKQPADNLELEIIDTYQADNVRSMNTLSGGETFLVSLSLALGLSDLAGRNTRIESLFIDEGFGTLDEATLDTAISALENLQSTGKTIGVISHVPALKERIATQIQMVKKGNGFSEIRII